MKCRPKIVLVLVLSFSFLGCNDSSGGKPSNEDSANSGKNTVEKGEPEEGIVVQMEATSLPKISAEFVKFDTDSSTGRVVDFKLINNSKYPIMGFRADIIATDAKGKVVYEFPWSKVQSPSVAEPNTQVDLDNIGFEIPKEAIAAKLVFTEFDVRDDSKDSKK